MQAAKVWYSAMLDGGWPSNTKLGAKGTEEKTEEASPSPEALPRLAARLSRTGSRSPRDGHPHHTAGRPPRAVSPPHGRRAPGDGPPVTRTRTGLAAVAPLQRTRGAYPCTCGGCAMLARFAWSRAARQSGDVAAQTRAAGAGRVARRGGASAKASRAGSARGGRHVEWLLPPTPGAAGPEGRVQPPTASPQGGWSCEP